MTRMTDALRDVNRSITKLVLFDLFLNAVIIFLAFFLAFSLINVFALAAAIPAVAYLVVAFLRRSSQSKVKMLEQKFPGLRERLSAAADTRQVQNPVADALHTEVLQGLSKVEESAFFDPGSTYIKTAVIVALSFAILLFSPLAFDLDGKFINFEKEQKREITLVTGSVRGNKQLDDPNVMNLQTGTEDIFGERSVAALGQEELTLELQPAGHEINIRDVQDAPQIDFQETFPSEVAAQSTFLFEENIAEEHQELVKTYFTKIAQVK